MDILDRLIEKLNIMSRDFEIVLADNKRLRRELDQLKVEKEILEKNSQDVILAIKNKLNQENQR